jgi:hypothetical protein
MQVAVWLWWETGLHPAAVLTLCQIIDYFLFNEADRLFLLAFVLNNLFHIFNFSIFQFFNSSTFQFT